MLPRPVATYLIVLTSVGWAANLVVELVTKEGGDPAVHGVFTFVIGVLYAVSRKNRPGQNQSGESGSADDPGGGPE